MRRPLYASNALTTIPTAVEFARIGSNFTRYSNTPGVFGSDLVVQVEEKGVPWCAVEESGANRR